MPRVRGDGRIDQVAVLHALAPRGWWWDTPAPPQWLAEEHVDGIFPDLPWFLDDLRPQGFLGRAFAQRHAAALGLPPDPVRWNADDVLVALLGVGDDLTGDLVIGDRPSPPCSMRGWATRRRSPTRNGRRASRASPLRPSPATSPARRRAVNSQSSLPCAARRTAVCGTCW